MQTQADINVERNKTHIDTLIHIGAGRCIELDEYLALQCQRLFLVEADPHLAKALQNRIQGEDHAQVSCVAIAGNPGPATFYRYNLPEANSLHPASGLTALFPGLKLVEQQQVKTVSPATLLQPLKLQAEKENRLVIDLPGEELPVLKALKQSQHLDLFSQVHLYCGREPLYEGSIPAMQVLEWLGAVGYDVVYEDNSRDPDRPYWSLRRNNLQLRNRDLQRQQELLTEENGNLKQLTTDLQEQTALLVQDRDNQTKLANKRQALIDQLTIERDHQAKLVADLQAQTEMLTQDRDAHMKLANDRLALMDQLTIERDHQAKLVADLQAQTEMLTQDRDAHIKLANDRQALMDQLTIERDHQAKLVADLQAQTEMLTQDRDAHIKLANDRQALMDQLTIERDHQAKLVADLQAQTEMLTQDRDAHMKLANNRQMQLEQRSEIEIGLRQELIDARQNTSVSIRLQALREADLKDLQARYQESQLIQENQHQLLVKLSERLNVASNYFRQLANSNTEPLSHKKIIQKTKKGHAKKKKEKQDLSHSAHKLSNKDEGEG